MDRLAKLSKLLLTMSSGVTGALIANHLLSEEEEEEYMDPLAKLSKLLLTMSSGVTGAMIANHLLSEEEEDDNHFLSKEDVIASRDDIHEDSDMDRVVIDADDKEVILSIRAERRLLKLLNEREKRSSLYI